MTVLKTEKGVKLPPKKIARTGRTPKYPFRTMNADESFFIKVCKEMPNPVSSLKSLVSIYNAKLAPKKFALRQMDGGARVFRIA